MSYLPPFRTRRPGAAEAEDDALEDEPMLLGEHDIVRDANDARPADERAGSLPPWEDPVEDDIPTLTMVVEPLAAPEAPVRAETATPGGRAAPPPPWAEPAQPPAAAVEDATQDEDVFIDAAPAGATVEIPAPAPARADRPLAAAEARDSVESGLAAPAVEPESAGMVVVLDDERIERLVDGVMGALQPAMRAAVRDAIRRNLLEDDPAA